MGNIAVMAADESGSVIGMLEAGRLLLFDALL
jgi:hypothetical protein